MNSTNRHGAIVQERDRHLLRELAIVRVFDREQARIIGGFGSASRTNRRLRALTEAGLLRRFFLGTAAAGRKALYGLSPLGAHLVDVPHRGLRRRPDEVVATDFFVQHQLTVNGIYCALKYGAISLRGAQFVRWVAFSRPLAPNLPLIPDGYVELQTPAGVIGSFLEVDLGNETRAVWKTKVENYLKLALSDEREQLVGQRRFRVLVVANSERRMLSIRTVVAEIVDKIFWFATLPAIAGDGFFQPVWLRPTGDERVAVIPQP
jgi:hypothetical protein